jgi:hypothetical protein
VLFGQAIACNFPRKIKQFPAGMSDYGGAAMRMRRDAHLPTRPIVLYTYEEPVIIGPVYACYSQLLGGMMVLTLGYEGANFEVRNC